MFKPIEKLQVVECFSSPVSFVDRKKYDDVAVRELYPKVTELIMADYYDRTNDGCAVIGTPGFDFNVLYCALKKLGKKHVEVSIPKTRPMM